MFLLIGFGLALLTAVVLVWPLLSRSSPTREISEEQLAASFRDRQQLIHKDREAGLMTPEQAALAEEALAKELAERLSALQPPTPAAAAQTQSGVNSAVGAGKGPKTSSHDSPRRPWLAAFLIAALPVLGISAYLLRGSPELTLPGALQAQGVETRHALLAQLTTDPLRYQESVSKLRATLEQNPEDTDSWLMLAMLQKAAGDYSAALGSFEEASKRGADRDARFLAEHAEAIALSRDKRFAGEPYAMLQQAMRLDGKDSKVLSLMAAAHYQAGERAQARALLEQLLAAMAPENPQAGPLRELIAGLAVPPGTPAAPAPASGSARIEVSLRIDPEMLIGLGPEAVLFVSARAAQGPRMPIAVWRGPVPGPGVDPVVVLDARHQLDPARKLEGALTVEAHIARSGQAGRQPGDPIADPASLELVGQDSGLPAKLNLHLRARHKP